ncbi:MAG: DUF86 domain-containing protein [Atribacterota bacterium]|nr:DUF86 domain-containing protein [Atribacterota bacterium]
MKEYEQDLEHLGTIDLDTYLKDKKIRYITERLLLLIAETILDISDYILSVQHRVISESYEGILDNAYQYELLPPSLYQELKDLGTFQNVLVHEYLKLNNQEVHRNYPKVRQILPNLLTTLEDIV